MTDLKAELRAMAVSLYKPRPFCRECADHNGICPYDKEPCSPVDRAESALHAAVKLVLEREIKPTYLARKCLESWPQAISMLNGEDTISKERFEFFLDYCYHAGFTDCRAMTAQLLKELE